MLVQVFDPEDGSLRDWWIYNQDEWCWGARTHCTSEMCGGCQGCIEMQCHYYGWRLVYLEGWSEWWRRRWYQVVAMYNTVKTWIWLRSRRIWRGKEDSKTDGTVRF